MNEIRNSTQPKSRPTPKTGLAGFQGQGIREGLARNRQDEENELQAWWNQQDLDEIWIGEQYDGHE